LPTFGSPDFTKPFVHWINNERFNPKIFWASRVTGVEREGGEGQAKEGEVMPIKQNIKTTHLN